MKSEYLDTIIEKRNQTTGLKVVFVDVKSYSKRRSQTQVDVVSAFMECLTEAKQEVSREFVVFAQDNNVNFKTDIIVLPTGDGAAIGFPFEGLHEIHLSFAKALLKAAYKRTSAVKCDKFEDQGWCNCHPHFKIKIGIDEGKGIIYKDLNENYNIAGNVINMAARVMGQGDAGQIVFTESAYDQLIDLVDDPHLDEKFTKYTEVKIKHGLAITICQYVDSGLDYLNSSPPADLVLAQRAKAAIETLFKTGIPSPFSIGDAHTNTTAIIELMEKMGQVMGQLGAPAINIDSKRE